MKNTGFWTTIVIVAILVIIGAFAVFMNWAPMQTVTVQTPAPQASPPPETQLPTPIVAPPAPTYGATVRFHPDSVAVGQGVTVTWNLAGSSPATASSTEVVWDIVSNPGDFGSDVTVNDAGYAYATTDFVVGDFPVPGQYYTLFFPPEGATQIFYRVHAMIGTQNVWSAEEMVSVIQGPTNVANVPTGPSQVAPPIPQTEQYAVTVDNSGFTPSVLSAATPGDTIQLTLTVPPGNPNSLEIWGDPWTLATLQPGQSITETFIAGPSFALMSYAPNSDVVLSTANFLVPQAPATQSASTTTSATVGQESFNIAVDNNAFSPSSIMVARGDTVTLSFSVSATNPNALDIWGDSWGVVTVQPGTTYTASFIVVRDFKYNAYMPGTSIIVASGHFSASDTGLTVSSSASSNMGPTSPSETSPFGGY